MMALRVGKDVFDYINDVKIDRSKHAMKKRLQEYTPNPNSIDRLENIDQKFHLIVFSAEWCERPSDPRRGRPLTGSLPGLRGKETA